MDLADIAWQTPQYWTVQVVFHLMPYPSLQPFTCLETICTF